MKAIERLKRDHVILRAKLDVLESALRLGPDTWFVLREMCYTLSRQLQQHIRREEGLVAQCRAALTAQQAQQLRLEHRDEPERLRALNRLFLREHGRSLTQVAPVLRAMIKGLRQHMDEEERELFPVLERDTQEQEAGPMRAESSVLNEVSTVNSLIRKYPTTKSVFEQLFVNIPYEGADCLDEVAWRHGLEAGELINRLEQVIGSASCLRSSSAVSPF